MGLEAGKRIHIPGHNLPDWVTVDYARHSDDGWLVIVIDDMRAFHQLTLSEDEAALVTVASDEGTTEAAGGAADGSSEHVGVASEPLRGPRQLLDVVRSGAVLRGLAGPEPVTVVMVARLTDDAANVVYRTESGTLAERMVFATDLPLLTAVEPGAAFAFNGDPASFKLAAEARRIRLAHLFDPQAALGTSDVDPLPHQLRAVYEEMLPRQPLRYLLADDPGAGKTIMAGLLAKELIMRGDAANILVVAPGSLVDQWQDEMRDKFGLDFTLLTKDLINQGGNPFARGGLWLARLDVLARDNDGILGKACDIDWDLVIFDEAHKMSASVFGSEVKKTKRYQLGERLGTARSVLLMTATPHSGKEEQFQLFLALLDADRFEGVVREGTRRVDVSDLMRRLVKEELLRFDGTRLFPERRANTVQYPLSPPERALYLAVTDYVRNQMNLADRLADKDNRRKIAVGFALTTLQRRLASSPAAIHRSLERRLGRLQSELREARIGASRQEDLSALVVEDPDDLTDEEREKLEDRAVSTVTAAASVPELEAEIAALTVLEKQARAIRDSASYSKWDRLRETLDDAEQMRDASGARRKVIIFTEHRDTLDDITERLRNHLGRDDAVVTIHGGTRREDRRKAQETFRADDQCIYLVATDAAGEGVNLQNAHLLINYDLPWNPNRIEQRFGRVHRIGQVNVCHMWSIVARDTREGDVYTRLLEKLEQQRSALSGRVYDVLGQVFEGNSLRDLMIEAIRYGDAPEQRARLLEVVDEHVGDGIATLLAAGQLVPTAMTGSEIEEVRRAMERAEAVRLQPHHVEAFFAAAFADLGGTLRTREQFRYEIRSVPGAIKDQDRIAGRGTPVVNTYSRITFDRAYVRIEGHTSDATLMEPGHPLMAAILSLTGDRHNNALRRGTVLVDRNDAAVTPYVVCLLEHDVTDGRTDLSGNPRVVSRRVQYIRVDADGSIVPITQTPIPDLEPPTDTERQAAKGVLSQEWCQAADLKQRIVEYASSTVARSHVDEVTVRVHERVDKTSRLVRERLQHEINYWDRRAAEIRENERAGRSSRLPAGQAQARAEELARRLDRRMNELALERAVAATPPRVTGACLVLPQGWIDALDNPEVAAARAIETARVERIAVDAVLAVEASLKHSPIEMPHNNPGYDIESDTSDGLDFIEVKGRVEGGTTFVLTRQEAVTALNKRGHSVLALVRVHDDNTTTVCYVRHPLDKPIEPWQTSIDADWDYFWNRGTEMTAQ
jgi:superfamily II DNA or RNA helicase